MRKAGSVNAERYSEVLGETVVRLQKHRRVFVQRAEAQRVTILYWTAACLACVFVLVAIHETGHYLAGWAGGIPAREMRIRLLTFPQHVALFVNGAWVSPVSPDDFEKYLAKMQTDLPTPARLFLYTAGGFFMETLVAVGIVCVALALGYRWPAPVVAVCSSWLLVSYVLLMDLPHTMKTGVPCGDLSGLWKIARAPTGVLAFVLFAVRALLLWASLAEPGARLDSAGM